VLRELDHIVGISGWLFVVTSYRLPKQVRAERSIAACRQRLGEGLVITTRRQTLMHLVKERWSAMSGAANSSMTPPVPPCYPVGSA
jgi:hypothetical protein